MVSWPYCFGLVEMSRWKLLLEQSLSGIARKPKRGKKEVLRP